MPTFADNTTLVIRYQKGDSEAGEQLLAANNGLVYRIAWKFAPGGGSLEVEDLVQEGRLGLLRAAQSFDPSRGFQFSTYARYWVRQAISRAVDTHSRTIRLPNHVAQKAASRPDLAAVVMSTDALVGDDEDTRFVDLLPDPGDLEQETIARVDAEALLSQLRPNEQLVIRRRFGLDTGQTESLKEIGTDMGVTREYVRQVQNRALSKLRLLAA